MGTLANTQVNRAPLVKAVIKETYGPKYEKRKEKDGEVDRIIATAIRLLRSGKYEGLR